ncbi:sensor histidine kinase [Cohnella silvisoli]|uniref:Histidine kinase n=1 Tax=Cohnella silvisoli TaxID=2873699 RepID=A0ABV1KRM4_9BACL|nr:histidine kinase [Cohnella silvisoli]MCD9022454.1 histidine kinase [Cohnella silvisoli]
MNWRISRFSIFTKLVLAFLIVIIPLYVMTLLMNRMGTEQNKREISKSLAIKVHGYRDSLEYEIQRLIELEKDYIVDSDLLQLSKVYEGMTYYERNIAVNNLQKRLRIMGSSSKYIRDTRIYIPSINRTVSASDYGPGIAENEFNAFNRGADQKPLIHWDGGLFVSYPYATLLSEGKKIAFIMVIEIDQEQIRQSMNAAMNADGSGAMLVRSNEMIVTTGSNEDAAAVLPIANVQRESGTSPYTGIVRGHSSKLLAAAEYSSFLDTVFVAYVPEKLILGPLKQYERWFWAISAISVIVVVFFSFWIYRLIHKPLVKLIFAFRKVEDGYLFLSLQPKQRDEFGYLYTAFNNMVQRLSTLIQEVYEEKIRSGQAELKRLQSQINPHFLFNNHFILARLIKSHDHENAYRFAQYMGEYLQFVTRDAQAELLLEREVKHARTYVDIQTFCFASKVQVRFDSLPEPLNGVIVPRLILQPVIENAYKYVFEKRLSGGTLHVRFPYHQDEEDIAIVVEDDGDSLDDQDIEHMNRRLKETGDRMESTGLINIHRRIQIMYGPKYGLVFNRSELGGLKVEIRIGKTKG